VSTVRGRLIHATVQKLISYAAIIIMGVQAGAMEDGGEDDEIKRTWS
jgi:hypothetical protein